MHISTHHLQPLVFTDFEPPADDLGRETTIRDGEMKCPSRLQDASRLLAYFPRPSEIIDADITDDVVYRIVRKWKSAITIQVLHVSATV